MKKRIITSIFLALSLFAYSEESTERAKIIYEYRPPILIELDNKIATPRNRGILRQLYRQYDVELNSYLERFNNDPEIIFFLANEYMMMNNYERANRIFLKDNSDLKNVFGAATTYRFMAKNVQAIEKYNEAITINSNFAENYLGRALANRNLDNYGSSINDLNRYISMTSAEEGYIALADIYFKLRKRNEAYKIAQSGVAKYPNSKLLNTLLINISKNNNSN